MAEFQTLSISDAESGYRAISDLIMSFPGFPDSFIPSHSNVRWNMISDKESIGLFPLNGAVYIKKYVSGMYVAQLPFEIIYKTTVTTDKANVFAQDLVTRLGEWLEKCDITFEDGKTILDSITRTTPVFIGQQNEKMTEFCMDMQLLYTSKK